MCENVVREDIEMDESEYFGEQRAASYKDGNNMTRLLGRVQSLNWVDGIGNTGLIGRYLCLSI